MKPAKQARSSQTKKRTRIQQEKEQLILDAGLQIFSTYGFRGSTVDQIAIRAGMSKPNMLYYYRRKQDLYLAVLNRTLEMWLDPLEDIDANGDPEQEIGRYISKKIEYSKLYPEASRLFVSEILQGAPILKPVLETRLHDLVDAKAKVIRKWCQQGKLANTDPYHLIFLIWAATQHYADFETQIRAILKTVGKRDAIFRDANEYVKAIILNGILPRA
ncbi:MAG: TetR family transcriptional regulator C-terminal domain-containing protein [Rhodospirillales bacterium]|nr:TetR family transcriptional regulator C-terminal domain-containing protein [Rhodospirillales bacterium]